MFQADIFAVCLNSGKCLHSAEKVWWSQYVVWYGIGSILYWNCYLIVIPPEYSFNVEKVFCEGPGVGLNLS